MVAVGQSVREQVAAACRLLAAEGYADLTLGHVSARAMILKSFTWTSRPPGALLSSLTAPSAVTADSLVADFIASKAESGVVPLFAES